MTCSTKNACAFFFRTSYSLRTSYMRTVRTIVRYGETSQRNRSLELCRYADGPATDYQVNCCRHSKYYLIGPFKHYVGRIIEMRHMWADLAACNSLTSVCSDLQMVCRSSICIAMGVSFSSSCIFKRHNNQQQNSDLFTGVSIAGEN